MLRLSLLAAFVLLAVLAGVPALRAAGVKRGNFSIRKWVNVNLEFTDPRPKDHEKDDEES